MKHSINGGCLRFAAAVGLHFADAARRQNGGEMNNEMKLEFDAVSENEGFARVAVAAFITPLDPTLEEVADIKTAVSEAVTNAIIHGYAGWSGDEPGKVEVRCCLRGDVLHIEIEDKGRGIADVEQAMEPLFTTRPDMDRSGMGFAFMEAFMDDLDVTSEPGRGTLVKMEKKLGTLSWSEDEE